MNLFPIYEVRFDCSTGKWIGFIGYNIGVWWAFNRSSTGDQNGGSVELNPGASSICEFEIGASGSVTISNVMVGDCSGSSASGGEGNPFP